MQRIFYSLIIILLFDSISFPVTLQTKTGQTAVKVGIFLTHLDRIDVKAQTFYAEFYLNMKWRGNHSASNFELMNANSFEKYFEQEWIDRDTSWLACKIRGTFRCKMDVTNFPLDEQKLIIDLGDFIWVEDSLIYIVNPEISGKYKGIYSAEWNISGYQSKVITSNEMGSNYSVLQYAVFVERKTTSFLIKILIPILIVMGVSMLNLFIDKKEIEACIGLGVTSLLSIIALYFSISDNLPDVNYATTVDKMMMGSYLVIFITMIEIVVAHNLINKNKIGVLDKVEIISKWVIPIGYSIFLLFIFIQANLLKFVG